MLPMIEVNVFIIYTTNEVIIERYFANKPILIKKNMCLQRRKFKRIWKPQGEPIFRSSTGKATVDRK